MLGQVFSLPSCFSSCEEPFIISSKSCVMLKALNVMNTIVFLVLLMGFIPSGASSEEMNTDAKRKGVVFYGEFCKGTYGISRQTLTSEEAARVLKDCLEKRGFLVEIRDDGQRFIRADVYRGKLLTDTVLMDKKTGRIRTTY